MATHTIVDFRVREEMAGAVLKEVAVLEPAERLRETSSLTQVMARAVEGLEELWEDLREPLRGGVSPSEAATLGGILTRSANLIGSSLELLARENPSIEEFKNAHLLRLQRIKARAASLRQLVEMPAPIPDPERLRLSALQSEKDEGVDAGDFLAELER
jgi:hypothetical protein